ncbi:MAG: hypothetical protein HZB53_20050 [Chloroflexi bacterium]|nr:hypothetical protein [Chloroflexota bacterium]
MLTKDNRPAGNRAANPVRGRASRSKADDSTNRRAVVIRVGRVIVGHVRGDTFYKTLRAGHFLTKPPAIAFDLSTLHDAERAGARWVHVTAAETGRTYRASMATIWTRGFRVARGFGEQWALSLAEWAHDGETVGAQLPLFD